MSIATKVQVCRSFISFSHPITNRYPAMIELFTQKAGCHPTSRRCELLTPLPMDEDISDLSAILLDDDYYEFF